MRATSTRLSQYASPGCIASNIDRHTGTTKLPFGRGLPCPGHALADRRWLCRGVFARACEFGCRHAGDLCSLLGRILRGAFLQLLETKRVILDVVAILETFGHDHVHSFRDTVSHQKSDGASDGSKSSWLQSRLRGFAARAAASLATPRAMCSSLSDV